MRRCVLALALIAVPAVLSAQQVITGVVRDSTGRVVSGAEVFISQRTSAVRTDAAGRFRIDSVYRGDYWLYTRKMGFTPTRHSITVPYDQPVRFADIILPQLPPELDTVAVTARSGFGSGVGSAQWFSQDTKAWGRLITRDRIEASRAPRLAALLRQYVASYPLDLQEAERALAAQGQSPVGLRLAASGQPCVPAVSFNGNYPTYTFDPEQISVDDVEAIEIFRAGAGTPLALAMQTPRGSCGLIRVWMRGVAQ
jgi:hypothetical protein